MIFAQVIGGPASPSYHGAVLTADVNIGDTVLYVDDTADFDEDAAAHDGAVMVGLNLDLNGMIDPASGTVLAYLTCDDEADTITLSVPSPVMVPASDMVYVQNPVTGLAVGETEVMVMLDDADETGDALMVSIDTSMLGGYAFPDLTGHAVELDEDEDGQLMVRNLPGLAQALPWVTPGEDEPPVTVVDTSTGVVLASGVSDPTAKATGVVGYPSVPLQLVSRSGTLGAFALNPTQVACMCDATAAGFVSVAQVVTGGSRVWLYDYTTGAYSSSTDYQGQRIVGMATAGGVTRMLTASGTALTVYDPSNGVQPWNAYTPVNTGQDPAFGSDGTTFIVAENDPGAATTVRVRDLGAWNNTTGTPPAVTVASTTVLGANTKTSNALEYVGRGAFDFGAAKYVYAGPSTSTYVTAASAGATRDSTLGWPLGVGARLAQCWVPAVGAFFVFTGDGNLYRYTGTSVADGLTQWWTGLTWKDTAGTPHETRLGPASQVTMSSRAQLQVTIPAPPLGTGSADDVNAYGLYMTKVASGTPNAASFHLQVSAAPDPGATSTQVITAVNMGGAAPPTTNGFPTVGVSGYLASQAADASGPIIMLKGDGSGRLGQASWDTTGVWAGGPIAASGTFTSPAFSGTPDTPVSTTVTFPAGRFTTTPVVMVTAQGSGPFMTGYATPTTTGAIIWVSRRSSSTTPVTVAWLAVQVT